MDVLPWQTTSPCATCFRGDPELRAEYGNAKLALGDRELEDINEYLAGKSAVLAKIVKPAGLSDPERSEIARMNPPTLG